MLPTKRSPCNEPGKINLDRIRRRRVTTACITCRDKRIKCDRSKSICAQCRKAGRECRYVDDEILKIEFVTEPQSQINSDPVTDSVDLDTWTSVIKSQADLVEQSGDRKERMPSWAVADAQEPSQARTVQTSIISRFYGIPVSALGGNFLHVLQNELPSKEICQQFFESFLLNVHPIVPLCHAPTLRREFDNFWTSVSSTSVEALILIMAVLYTGAVNTTLPSVHDFSVFLRLYEEISERIDILSYYIRDAGTSIQLLQGLLIMNTYKASQLAPFAAFGFMPQTIRFAQSLRLHVDRSVGNPIEQEVRRRLWWHLIFLDMESIIANGLPPITRSDRYTTAFPSLLHDHSIMEQQDSVAGPVTGEISPMMVAVRGHYELAHHMQLWFEQIPSQKEAKKFKTVIENLLLLLPLVETAETIWTRLYLKMQVNRAYCMLGLRFWQLDKYERTGCQSEVVKTAQSFLTYYLQLAKFPTSNLNLEWYISGLLQPLHGIIILLMHLGTCPSVSLPALPQNDCLSSRFLLDSILTLRVRHIISGKILPTKALFTVCQWPHVVNSRYHILVELRKRVWKKIGWDRDGKGIDPWDGRLEIAEAVALKTMDSSDSEQKRAKVVSALGESQAESDMADFWSGGMRAAPNWPDSGHSSGEFDALLKEDPLDLLQWDEWESLTQGLFAS